MEKNNDDNLKTKGGIYFKNTYNVSDIDYEPETWHLASVDWSSNMNHRIRYLVYLAKEKNRVFVKPYKHFHKSEYEVLFGESPGEAININRVIEITGGNYTATIYKE